MKIRFLGQGSARHVEGFCNPGHYITLAVGNIYLKLRPERPTVHDPFPDDGQIGVRDGDARRDGSLPRIAEVDSCGLIPGMNSLPSSCVRSSIRCGSTIDLRLPPKWVPTALGL